MFEGILEVKLPTIWKGESRGGKSQRREEKRTRKKIREEKQFEERKCRCAMICGSGESK